MGTHAWIGFQSKNGKAKGIYLHSDGDFAEAGKMLLAHYKSASKVKALIELGGLSCLGSKIGIKHPFEIPDRWNADHTTFTKEYEEYISKYKDMTLAYYRDRDDPWNQCEPISYANAEAFWEDSGERWAFMYLFSERTGEWQCRQESGIPKKLTKKIIDKALAERAARIAAIKAEDEQRRNAHAATRS